LRSGTEGNCTVGQVLFLTEQVSLQKTPPKEPSWHGVITDVIEQLRQTRPPMGTVEGGLGETEGTGLIGGSTEGAGTLIGGSTEGDGTGLIGGSTEGDGTGLIGGSTEAVILAIAKKDEYCVWGLGLLDGKI
jgi:hypothetical protein